jgi:hypothetical protein
MNIDQLTIGEALKVTGMFQTLPQPQTTDLGCQIVVADRGAD